MKDYPCFEVQIDEADGAFVNAIALVNSPAIESNFLAFSETELKFSSDEDKMELIGAAMIPDMPIFRLDSNSNPYYVKFSKDTVRSIAQVYMKKGFQNSLNIEHTDLTAKSYVFQSYDH